jgi:hypothetical protein
VTFRADASNTREPERSYAGAWIGRLYWPFSAGNQPRAFMPQS